MCASSPRDVTFPDERAPRGRRHCGFGCPYPLAAISCAGRQMTNRVHFQGFALSGVSHLPLSIELERLGGAAAMCNQVQRIVAGSLEQIARKSCDTDDITWYT